MSLRYPGFDWTEETPEGTKRKEREPNDPAWHMLEHYEALKQNNPEAFDKEYVKWYIDGILVGTHDANVTNYRVPQGAENMFLYINVSSYDSNVRTLHISDFIAYTEV